MNNKQSQKFFQCSKLKITKHEKLKNKMEKEKSKKTVIFLDNFGHHNNTESRHGKVSYTTYHFIFQI